MSSALVDYVVVCGSPTNPDETVFLPQIAVNRYIVDVVVVFPSHETVPDGYERVRLSPGGREIDLNSGKFWRKKCWVAVKYGWSMEGEQILPADTPISELPLAAIAVCNGNVKLSKGWVTVKETVGGRNANVNTGSSRTNEIYLIYKRIDPLGEPTKMSVVTNLTVIDKYYEEECPVGYLTIEMNLNKGSSGGHDLNFCTKTLSYISDSRRIGPVLLERFPRSDPKKARVQLPPSIEQFCMPQGVQIRFFQKSHQVPLPEWHPFVLTEGDGVKLFGAALVFWELCTDPKERQEKLSLLKSGETTSSCSRLLELAGGRAGVRKRRKEKESAGKHAEEYRTKCIAILSHYPFFQGFKKSLKLLYRVAMGGQSAVPIERYISNLVLSVPLPSPGTNVVLDWGLGDSNAIVFRRPEREDLPMLGVSFLPLFHMLSIPNIIRVWSLMLLERKIIFHSRDIDVITPILEALRVLTFPLSYMGLYIPMCATHIMSMLLQAPVPHCIGIASEGADRIDIPDGTWVVDIDNDRVGLTVRGYPSKTAGFGVDFLPQSLFQRFSAGLRKVSAECGVCRDGVAEVSNVFQSSQSAAMAANQGIDEDKIRDLALTTMIDLLDGYDQYLCINREFNLNRDQQNMYGLEAVFRLDDYVASKPSEYQDFLISLGDTQSFSYMMNERTYPGQNDLSFVFFDHCTAMWRKNNSSSSSAASPSPPPPDTLRNQVMNMTKFLHRRSSITLPRTRSGEYSMRPAHGSPESLARIASLAQMPHPLSGLMDYEINRDDAATDIIEWCRAKGLTSRGMGRETETLIDHGVQFHESEDGTMVLVVGPSKQGLEHGKMWETTIDFALQDALFEPTITDPLTGKLVALALQERSASVSVDETLPARSRSEQDEDHVEAARMYGGSGSVHDYYEGVTETTKIACGQKSATFHLRQLFGAWSLCTSVRIAIMLENNVNLDVSRGIAHTSVTSMLYMQSLLSGQPLDEASYRAVLIGCNLTKLRYDIGAAFVEDGLNRCERQANALTDGQIAIARAEEVKANAAGATKSRDSAMEQTKSYDQIDRLSRPLKLWDRNGSKKPLVCMWAVFEQESEESAEKRRTVPETHILVGVCSKIINSRRVGGDCRRRPARICYLAEGSKGNTRESNSSRKSSMTGLSRRRKKLTKNKKFKQAAETVLVQARSSLRRGSTKHEVTLSHVIEVMQRRTSVMFQPAAEVSKGAPQTPPHPLYQRSSDIISPRQLSMVNEEEEEGEEDREEEERKDEIPQIENETKTATSSSNLPLPSQPPSSPVDCSGAKQRCQISSCSGAVQSVDYLSPHELRTKLEQVLRLQGRRGLSKKNIKEEYPTLFYNLVWYCTRMKLNFPLFTTEREEVLSENTGKDDVEEQVLLGPHERWARECIAKRQSYLAKKGRHVLQVVMGGGGTKYDISSDNLIQSASNAFVKELPPSYSLLPKNIVNNLTTATTTANDDNTRLAVQDLTRMINYGDVDKALTKMLRSQHLYFPELHKHTVYSTLRFCASNTDQAKVLLDSEGTGGDCATMRTPKTLYSYHPCKFDRLYHHSYLNLSPQMQMESIDLHQSGGYMMADLHVGVFRHLFGDIFHGLHDEMDDDDENSDDNATADDDSTPSQ